MTDFPIMYPLEKKDICDYDPRCIMSSGLVFDYIIMNIIRNKKLARHNEKMIVFLYRFRTTSFICAGSHFNTFTEKKGTYECIVLPCVHFHLKITDMKQYSTHILKKRHFKG